MDDERKTLREQIVACLKERGKLEYCDLLDDLETLYSRTQCKFPYNDYDGQLAYLTMRGTIKASSDGWEGAMYYWIPTQPKQQRVEPTPLLDAISERGGK